MLKVAQNQTDRQVDRQTKLAALCPAVHFYLLKETILISERHYGFNCTGIEMLQIYSYIDVYARLK